MSARAEEGDVNGTSGPVLAAGGLDALAAILLAAALAECAGVEGRGYGDPRNGLIALGAMVYPVVAYYGVIWSLGRWALGVSVENITWRRQLDRDRPIYGKFSGSRAAIALRLIAVSVAMVSLLLALRQW
jgi:hypothetical protein